MTGRPDSLPTESWPHGQRRIAGRSLLVPAKPSRPTRVPVDLPARLQRDGAGNVRSPHGLQLLGTSNASVGVVRLSSSMCNGTSSMSTPKQAVSCTSGRPPTDFLRTDGDHRASDLGFF